MFRLLNSTPVKPFEEMTDEEIRERYFKGNSISAAAAYNLFLALRDRHNLSNEEAIFKALDTWVGDTPAQSYAKRHRTITSALGFVAGLVGLVPGLYWLATAGPCLTGKIAGFLFTAAGAVLIGISIGIYKGT